MAKKASLRIGLFCGARKGSRPEFTQAAEDLGSWIGRSGHTLVYGGGSVGLMGVVADATLATGGKVFGIITEKLIGMEVGHGGITDMMITPTMAERKIQLIAQSDLFVILPGGLGTYDELFEVLTLRQLGYHDKKTYVVNMCRYFDPFLRMVEHAAAEGFMSRDNLGFFQPISGIDELVLTLDSPARY